MTPSPPPYTAIPQKANNTFQVKETSDGEWIYLESEYPFTSDSKGCFYPKIFWWMYSSTSDELKLWNDKNT